MFLLGFVFGLAAVAPVLARPASQESPSQRGVSLEEGGSEAGSTSYGRRHALVIGIDEYEDPAYPDLGYAVADARAVAKTLVQGYGFEAEDVRLILNEDASKVALEAALEDWACDGDRVGEDDLFVVFFAGHGMTRSGSRGSRGYLVPVEGASDTHGEPVWSSLLGMDDLEDVSELVPAKHVLFVLDCCFGGLAVSRAAPPVAAGLSNRARQVITAGNAEQAVLDTGGGGHSVFTGALLDGLEGGADLDGDGVITFGELYNHVGREVERKTEERQTPLQATFPDHEGGNVALFAPGVEPGRMSASERLKALERSSEEQLAEMNRLADALLVQDLVREADDLWPQTPDMVPRYRDWLVRAKGLLERRSQHESSVRHVRQEAYLSQVVAGQVEEGEGSEPSWEEVDPKLRWRFETFQRLLDGLDGLEALRADVEGRLAVASALRRRTIEDHAGAWEEVVASVAGSLFAEEVEIDERGRVRFERRPLELAPQLGLVPIGRDPRSGLWEFADVQTGAIPQRDPQTGELQIDEESALVLVLLPGGTFTMGAQAVDPSGPNYDPQAESDEGPPRETTVPPFFLSKYELTQGQWLRFTGDNPSSYGPGSTFGDKVTTLRHPVEEVSWDDCARILPRMGLTLPGEAQWEYAARAATSSPWWSGAEKESLQGVANLADAFAKENGGSTAWQYESWGDGYTLHAPVGSFAPNGFGLHDVHGNVWEWCMDEIGAAYRATRGGSFNDAAADARSAGRLAYVPSGAGTNLGVRPARVITE